MEDTSLFMQWAMDTPLDENPAPAVDDQRPEATFPSLQAVRDASHAAEMVQELMAEAHAANSGSSGDRSNTDGWSGGTVPVPAPAAKDCSDWPLSPNSSRSAPPPSSSTNLPAVSWNFSTGSAQPGCDGGVLEQAATRSFPELPHRSPPTKGASAKSSGPASSASYAPDHIIAERKRRERINTRIIELSTVIPGLKKVLQMDKATILSDAARYVRKLQERLKAMEEAAGNNGRSIETVVLVKKPSLAAPADNGSCSSSASSGAAPAATTKPLPEIEARCSEKSVMVRIHCESGKGVAARALAEVEELGLSIVHANITPFPTRTVIITITAKEEGFTVTAEEIVGRLNSALSH